VSTHASESHTPPSAPSTESGLLKTVLLLIALVLVIMQLKSYYKDHKKEKEEEAKDKKATPPSSPHFRRSLRSEGSRRLISSAPTGVSWSGSRATGRAIPSPSTQRSSSLTSMGGRSWNRERRSVALRSILETTESVVLLDPMPQGSRSGTSSLIKGQKEVIKSRLASTHTSNEMGGPSRTRPSSFLLNFFYSLKFTVPSSGFISDLLIPRVLRTILSIVQTPNIMVIPTTPQII